MRPFRAILWKEWVSLRPFAVLLFALFLFGLAAVQATEYFDNYPIWDNVVMNSTAIVWVTFILCVVVSMGLLVREKDEGTLLYLDGLPLSRFSLYLAKWIVAVGLITAISLLWTAEGIVYDLLSRGSASPPVPWRSIGVFATLLVFLGAYFTTILLAFSFLRLWSLIVVGGLFWIVFWLKSLQVPYAELLDPFTLIEAPPSMGDPWEWPRLQLLLMGGSACAAWIVGYGIFALRPGTTSAFAREMKEAWWGKLAGGCSIFLVLAVWFGLFTMLSYEEGMRLAEEEAESESSRPTSPKGRDEIVTAESEHFLFIHRNAARRRMNTVIRKADPVFGTVADFLEVPEEMRGQRITVDLSSPLAAHNAGQAYWKKIRMALPQHAYKGEREAIAILGHEVSHVFTDQIAQGRLEESFESARWFHEGLASYVEFRFFREEGEAREYRRWVALASRWGEVDFAEMVDNGVFSAKRDPFLAYPAGYLWVECLVRVYGDGAPAALLRAVGREGGPRKLSGLALWRDACLAAGFDLERVRTDFRNQLRTLREEFGEEIAPFPEITSGSAVRRGDKIVIRPALPEGDLPEGARLVCRVRPRPDAAPSEWRYSGLSDDGAFEVPALSFLKPGVAFQAGWKFEDSSAGQPVFGEWVNLAVATE